MGSCVSSNRVYAPSTIGPFAKENQAISIQNSEKKQTPKKEGSDFQILINAQTLKDVEVSPTEKMNHKSSPSNSKNKEKDTNLDISSNAPIQKNAFKDFSYTKNNVLNPKYATQSFDSISSKLSIDTIKDRFSQKLEPSLSEQNMITKRSFNSLHSPMTDDEYQISPINYSISSDSLLIDTELTQKRPSEFKHQSNSLDQDQDQDQIQTQSQSYFQIHSHTNTHSILSDNLDSSIGSGLSLNVSTRARASTLNAVLGSLGDSSPSTISSSEDNVKKLDKNAAESNEQKVKMRTTVRSSLSSDGKKMVNEYVMIKKIGKGSYGKVKLVADTTTNELYAMKICDRAILQKLKRDSRGRPIKSTDMDDLKKEVAILKKVEHPNVVRLYEVIDDVNCDKLYMIFEYVERGAVVDLTLNPTFFGFPEVLAKKYFRDLLKGLQYLHDQKIIHRDIKPENLLVDKNDNIKLTDFGVSVMFRGDDDKLNSSAGTPSYLPPEACQSGDYHGKPFDIWCCGVTLYVLLYGCVPFQGDTIMTIYHSIIHDEPKYPENINSDLLDIFSKLLEKKPTLRITLEELMIHPWVTDKGKNPIKNDYISPEAVSTFDIENAIAPGETLKLIDKFVLMSKLKSKFINKIKIARDKIQEQHRLSENKSKLELSSDNFSQLTNADSSMEISVM